MVAPLFDSRGQLRYHIGAQVDVSGLCKDATDLDSLRRLRQRNHYCNNSDHGPHDSVMLSQSTRPRQVGTTILHLDAGDEFRDLSEMFNDVELDVIRRCGGRMSMANNQEEDEDPVAAHRPRIHVRDPSGESCTEGMDTFSTSSRLSPGRLSGIFQNVSTYIHTYIHTVHTLYGVHTVQYSISALYQSRHAPSSPHMNITMLNRTYVLYVY